MMNPATSNGRCSPFPLKRILVLSDLGAAAENAAWRAALLAREHGAWLRIVHVHRWRAGAASAQRKLDALAWQLQEHLRVAVVAQSLRGGMAGELVAAAADADLVVVRAAGSGWTDVHPERVVRLGRLPTLVVRKPATVPYLRVLAAVMDAGHAAQCIAAAAGMVGGPHLALLRDPVLSDGDLYAPGQLDSSGRAPRVEAHIHQLAQASPTARMKEAPCVMFTPSPDMVLRQEQRMYPDLVVVPRVPGKVPHWLVASLAGRVLARTAADTLVLPVAAAARTAPSAGAAEPPAALGAHGAKVWPS